MSRTGAQTAVLLSAFWVAALFGYRKLTQTSLANAPQVVPQTSHFVIGFGFTFIVLSMVAAAAPPLGGMFAILVATGDTLVNGQAVVAGLQTGLKSTSTATGKGVSA